MIKNRTLCSYPSFISLLIVLSLFAFHAILLNPAGADETALNVDEILQNLDPEQINKSQEKDYFENIQGKIAKGKGTVVYVLPASKDEHKVRILTPAGNPHKGYNIVLFTNQNAPSDLKKGEQITFEGKVHRVNPYQGASLDILGTYKKIEVK